MRASTMLQLSRPSSSADRARFGLVAAAVAVDGAPVLWSPRVGRIRGGLSGTGLAPFVAEPGLRVGTAIAGLLLCVPVGALLVQGLRVGASARARSFAALRLAGATPGEVRRIASFESARAAVLGGALAGPAYVALWAILGYLIPQMARLVAFSDLGLVPELG